MGTLTNKLKGLFGAGTRQRWAKEIGIDGNWYESSPFGDAISPEQAMRISTVNICVKVIADSVSSLPLELKEVDQKTGSKTLAKNHPLYSLFMHSPNDVNTPQELFEFIIRKLLLEGTAYVEIVRNRQGRIMGLFPLYGDVRPRMKADGRGIVYDVASNEVDQTTGKPVYKRMPSSRIWRIAGMSDTGLVGMSPIAFMRNALNLASAAEQHGETYFSNGAHPGAIIESDKPIRDQGILDRLRSQFSKRYSKENAHKPLILEKGLTYKPITVSNRDSQFLEARAFQRAEIAAMFRVPLHMVGDSNSVTATSVEAAGIEFIRNTIRPWLVRIEQSIHRDLLDVTEKAKYRAAFNTSSLLRGDQSARYSSYASAIQNGWLSRAEVRTMEGLEYVDGLDEYLVQLNMADEEQLQNRGGDNSNVKEETTKGKLE